MAYILLLIYASLLCICITYIFLDSFGSFTSIPILHRKITIIFKVQNYTIIFGCTDSFVISENKTLVFTFCLSSKYNAIAKLQFTFTGQAFCSSNHAYLHFDPLPFICADFRIPVWRAQLTNFDGISFRYFSGPMNRFKLLYKKP